MPGSVVRDPGFAGDGRDREHSRTCEEQSGDCQTRGPKAWTDEEATLE